MWPTFYIPGYGLGRASPSGPVDPTRPSVVGYVCAVSPFQVNTYVDVPYPTGVQPGDFVIAYNIGFGTGAATTLTNDTTWHPITCFYSQSATSGGFGSHGPLAVHWYTGTEGATERFQFNNPSSEQVKICMVAYRGVDPSMPLGAWVWGDTEPYIDYTAAFKPLPMPSISPVDAYPALITIAIGGSTGGETIFDPAYCYCVPYNNDLQAEHPFTFDRGGGITHGVYEALWHPPNQYEVQNLLTHTHRNLNAPPWYKTNVTVNDSDPLLAVDGSYCSRVTSGTTVGAERKCIYRDDVYLEAGETYTWTLASIVANGGFSGYYLYMLVDDGTDEYGAFYESGTNVYRCKTKYGTAGSVIGWASVLTSGGTNQGSYTHVTFTAERTGYHRLSIGLSTSSATPEVTGYGGYYLLNLGMHLQKGMGHNTLDARWSHNGSSPVLSALGTRGRVMGRGLWTNGTQSTIELRRSGQVGTPVTLCQYDAAFSQLLDADRLSVMDNSTSPPTHNFTLPALYYDPMFPATTPIYPPALGASIPTKVYFEVEWLESTANNFNVMVGLCDSNAPFRSTTASGAIVGDYLWRASGHWQANTVTDTSPATTYSNGDIIGVGWDWDNMQVRWYKNGTLIRTMAIDTTRGAYHYPRWAYVRTTRFGDGGIPGFRANFAGPFGGRKPSGFSAYDWENEVT